MECWRMFCFMLCMIFFVVTVIGEEETCDDACQIRQFNKNFASIQDTMTKILNVINKLDTPIQKELGVCLDGALDKIICSPGDVNCTVNFITDTVNCTKCMPGDSPEEKSKDAKHCPHPVIQTNTNTINWNASTSNVTFKVIDEVIWLDLDSTHSTNTSCQCITAVYHYYKNGNSSPRLSDDINTSLLWCDDCQQSDELCYKDSGEGECKALKVVCTSDKPGNLKNCKVPHIHPAPQFKCGQPSGKGYMKYTECQFAMPLTYNDLKNGSDSEFTIEFKQNETNLLFCKNGTDDICSNLTCKTDYFFDISTCQLSKSNKEDGGSHGGGRDDGGRDDDDGSGSGDDDDDGSSTVSWLLALIVVIVILFLLYVGYQNYQKISDCVNGVESAHPTSRGRGRGRIKAKYGPIPMEEVVTRHDD